MSKTKKKLPFVSICTPTFNRRPFIQYIIKCFESQTYPKDKMEWVIIDDGTDCIEELVKHIPQVKYYYFKERMLLGAKRNLMHSKCSGEIIIYMDDDDYYPPERVSHAVDTLLANPTYLIAGSSIMNIYFPNLDKIYQCGPYGPNHSTAATFAFRKELLKTTQYNNDKALAEESQFLKNYTIPLKQLESLKTIVVFSHIHNSFDKNSMLENPAQSKMTLTKYVISDLIKQVELQKFYELDMNKILETYELGKVSNKPEVLDQIKKIKEERVQRANEQNKMIENQIINSKIFIDMKMFYEKQLTDKTYLISELFKKIKILTGELEDIKKELKGDSP